MTKLALGDHELNKLGVPTVNLPAGDDVRDQLSGIVCSLRTALTDEGISQWMTGPNFHLDGLSPAQVIEKYDGDLGPVRDAAEALLEGGFS